jgi:FeS assembly SUF system protein
MKPLPMVPASPAPPAAEPLKTAGMVPDPERTTVLRPLVVAELSKVFDPEIPVNIYELGLIYDIVIDRAGVVGIRMTLTAPACPAAQSLPLEVHRRIAALPGVSDARVDVVWDPPWDRDRMSDAARLQLGLF